MPTIALTAEAGRESRADSKSIFVSAFMGSQ
jgi:hypothetical protein